MPSKIADQVKTVEPAESRVPDVRVVAFNRTAVAPENMRFKEPADDGIPQLGRTMLAAGNVTPIIVRPGKGSKESEFMILEGRRRWLAVEHLITEGLATDAFELKIEVETDPARQAAAVMLTNTERLPVHLADVIIAIGKMRKAKLSTSQIADALGYDELEIKRLEKLSSVDGRVLDALRANRITPKQARLIARLENKKDQKRWGESALNGTFYEHGLRLELNSDVVTGSDSRLILVGPEAYVAAGGRIEQDLFGEFPERFLDPAKLGELWIERVRPIATALEAEGLQVLIETQTSHVAPDGFEHYPTYSGRNQWSDERQAAVEPFDAAVEEARVGLGEVDPLDPAMIDRLIAFYKARTALMTAEYPGRTVGALVLTPGSNGRMIEGKFFCAPYVEPEEDDDADQDDQDAAGGASTSTTASRSYYDVAVPTIEVDVEGSSHALHENYTDYATRGLIRALADDPGAALTFVVAQLFSQIALSGCYSGSSSASTLKADGYRRHGVPAIEALDGEVRARLDAHRETYKASGLRPIAWVDTLAYGDKASLLAELVAMSLDLREMRTDSIRKPARAQAAELAELTGYDITAYWVPDAKFLALHGKKQLLAILEEMGEDDAAAKSLKKDDLVAYVAERCAERRFAPAKLGWSLPATAAADETDEDAIADDAVTSAADASDARDGDDAPPAEGDADDRDGEDDVTGLEVDADEDRFDPDFEQEFDQAA